jgi:hypothetical protein
VLLATRTIRALPAIPEERNTRWSSSSPKSAAVVFVGETAYTNLKLRRSRGIGWSGRMEPLPSCV